MFKKLEELLEAGKLDKEVAELIDAEFSTALKELREEAAKYRTKLKEAEGAYKEQLEEKTKELKEALEKAKAEGAESIAKEYEAKLNAVEAEKAEYERKAKDALIEASVNGVLASENVVDPEIAKLYIKSHLEVDGDNVFIKVGDERLTMESGAKKLFEQKPHLLSSSGNGGSNSGGGGGSSYTGKKKSEMSAADKASFIKDNGQEAYFKLED